MTSSVDLNENNNIVILNTFKYHLNFWSLLESRAGAYTATLCFLMILVGIEAI